MLHAARPGAPEARDEGLLAGELVIGVALEPAVPAPPDDDDALPCGDALPPDEPQPAAVTATARARHATVRPRRALTKV